MAHGLRGPSYCTTSACSSGAHAIGEAAEWIRRGTRAGHGRRRRRGDGHAGRHRRLRGDVRALASATTTPRRASRPFDKGRDGFVVRRRLAASSSSSRSRARRSAARRSTPRSPATARRATRYHLTQPAPHGEGAQRVDADGAQGRGRRARPGRLHQRARHLDAGGRHRRVARRSPRSSARTRTRQEALGELDQVDDGPPARRGRRGRERDLRARHRRGQNPADHQPDDQDPECPLDYVANTRASGASHALNNSFGFGGTNARCFSRSKAELRSSRSTTAARLKGARRGSRGGTRHDSARTARARLPDRARCAASRGATIAASSSAARASDGERNRMPASARQLLRRLHRALRASTTTRTCSRSAARRRLGSPGRS